MRKKLALGFAMAVIGYVGCGANLCNATAMSCGFGINNIPKNNSQQKWGTTYNNGKTNKGYPHGPGWPNGLKDDDYLEGDDAFSNVTDAIQAAIDQLCATNCESAKVTISCVTLSSDDKKNGLELPPQCGNSIEQACK